MHICIAAASSLKHPVYCSLSHSQMLQPLHFNVAGRDLAHERSCETAMCKPACGCFACLEPRVESAIVDQNIAIGVPQFTNLAAGSC